MSILNELGTQKKLQIIFTTHAQSLLNLDYIAVRHLYKTSLRTLCFSKTRPDALHRLTGTQVRPLEIFVEDDLAFTLIKKICGDEGLSKYVSINKYGAAINCFTSACGSIINNLRNQENMLFVLDGDEYKTETEKTEQIAKVLTGNTPLRTTQRQTAFSRITQFVLPNGERPEHYYHGLICNLNDANLTPEQLEIVHSAREIENPGNGHKFLDDVINRLDFTREVGLSKLVDLLALTPEWNGIKLNIRNWLDQKRADVVEQ